MQTETTIKDMNEMEMKLEEFKASGMNLSSEHCLVKVGTPEWCNSDDRVSIYTGLPSLKSYMLHLLVWFQLLCQKSSFDTIPRVCIDINVAKTQSHIEGFAVSL